MNYLTLFLTEVCNRKCPYCDIGISSNRRGPRTDLIEQFIPVISKSNWTVVHLTGGETGLVDPQVIDFVIKELKNKKLTINTNGVWFNKGYFEKYYDYVDCVQYHPVTEIDEYFTPIEDPKIIYNFPVHKKNVRKVRTLQETHRNILMRLTPYNEKHKSDEFALTIDDYQHVYSIIMGAGNIENNTKYVFKILSGGMDISKIKNFCAKYPVVYPSINFVDGTIQKCIKSHTRCQGVELTLENFNNINNIDFGYNDVCDTCTLFVGDFKDVVASYVRHQKRIFSR